jgi:hypothetical protein
VGGAADEIEIGQKGRADRRTKKGLEWAVRGPAVERATHGTIAGLEISRGEKLLVDDLRLEVGEEFVLENLDNAVGVAGALLGPIDGDGVGRGIDEEEIVVVIGGSIGGLGARAEAKVDGGIFGGPLFAEELFEFERVVIGKEDVVMSEGGILAFDAEEDDESGDGAGGATHLGGGLGGTGMADEFLIGCEDIPVVKDEISEDSLA